MSEHKMDGPLLDHSDSDSCESWTLLESHPAIGDEAPEFSETPVESPVPEIFEKDEDTDGISIISDSDHESHSPYQKNYEMLIPEGICSTENKTPQFASLDPHLSSMNTEESLRADNNKHRIYVHRRNKRLSTVLNIIMLGSVITAAGVAIGHMWGAKNDCSMHNPPAVNKILSNLYKLQEENAYLRSKLKELSQFHQSQQKVPVKHNRCKKLFEEPLNSKNVNSLTKCVDDNVNNNKLPTNFDETYEKDFIANVNLLKNTYQENKSWLDKEITMRLKAEEEMLKDNINKNTMPDKEAEKKKYLHSVNVQEVNPHINLDITTLDKPYIKVSYADSLKSDKHSNKIVKREANKAFENETSKFLNKKKTKNTNEQISSYVTKDEEFQKDDRYTGKKNKQEKKKYNRHKSFKKQKRRNKYEQWEMKGGFVKDYDDLSISSQDDLVSNNSGPKLVTSVTKTIDFTDKLSDYYDKFKHDPNEKTTNINSHKQNNWYEKRAALRKEARKNLEQELFGAMAPNTARWYFRRMQKREQCRIKDNSTNRKLNDKRDMNYKMKH